MDDDDADPPLEPPATTWQFPAVDADTPADLVAVGADLRPGTLLAAYTAGYFPMPLEGADAPGWWSPDPRGVLELRNLVVSRSLRRSLRRYEIRMDTSFGAVIAACADRRREDRWISSAIESAYLDLHELGWVHCIEAWDEDGLAGGLYGVCIGNFFAGESMFHLRKDASKVALIALAARMAQKPGGLIDVQWTTPHLESLGATNLTRHEYLRRLSAATALPGPDWPQNRNLSG